jgi:hypothetical protein
VHLGCPHATTPSRALTDWGSPFGRCAVQGGLMRCPCTGKQTSVDATTDPRLRPPDNVVEIPGCGVEGLPRPADVRHPLRDVSAANVMPEDVEEGIAEQATHDGPFRSARPRDGASVAECSCRQRSHPSDHGTTSSASIPTRAVTTRLPPIVSLRVRPVRRWQRRRWIPSPTSRRTQSFKQVLEIGDLNRLTTPALPRQPVARAGDER